MKQSGLMPAMGSQYDRFLMAPVGEDRNGMLLTVLSALSRLDIDPWDEAAALTRLPGVDATRKLASLLASLPGQRLADPESSTIASRLIALLPGRTATDGPAPSGAAAVRMAHRPSILAATILYLVLTLLMFAWQWLVSPARTPSPVSGASAIPAGNAAAPSDPSTRSR